MFFVYLTPKQSLLILITFFFFLFHLIFSFLRSAEGYSPLVCLYVPFPARGGFWGVERSQTFRLSLVHTSAQDFKIRLCFDTLPILWYVDPLRNQNQNILLWKSAPSNRTMEQAGQPGRAASRATNRANRLAPRYRTATIFERPYQSYNTISFRSDLCRNSLLQ